MTTTREVRLRGSYVWSLTPSTNGEIRFEISDYNEKRLVFTYLDRNTAEMLIEELTDGLERARELYSSTPQIVPNNESDN